MKNRANTDRERYVERYAAIAHSLYPDLEMEIRYTKGQIRLLKDTLFATILISETGSLDYEYGDTYWDNLPDDVEKARAYFNPLLLNIKSRYKTPNRDLTDEIAAIHAKYGERRDYPPIGVRVLWYIRFLFILLLLILLFILKIIYLS